MRGGVRSGGAAEANRGGTVTARPVPRRLVTSALLASGIASTLSGFLIQVHYHMHRATAAVWGYGYATWALVHQLSSVAFLVVVLSHLSLNWKPLLSLVRRRTARRSLGLSVTVLFLLAVVSALAAWGAFLLVGQGTVEKALVEMHDKVTIPFSGLLLLHVWRRRSRLFPHGAKGRSGGQHSVPAIRWPRDSGLP
jgi:hypothetical protein